MRHLVRHHFGRRVYEHLGQPIQFLSDCRHLLKPGGTLVVSTPNPYYLPIILLNRLMIRKCLYAPDHVFEIAPRHLARFLELERAGFVLESMVSGGMLLPLGRGRYLSLPLPKAIWYHMICVAEPFKQMGAGA